MRRLFPLSEYRILYVGHKVISSTMTMDKCECYLHNLNISYQRVRKATQIRCVPETISDYERGTSLQVFVGGELIHLSDDDFIKLNKLSQSTPNDAFILMDLRNDLYYENDSRKGNAVMESSWLKEIVPLSLESNQFIKDDYLMERLSTKDTSPCRLFQYFPEMFNERYMAIVDKLLTLYKQGSIANVDDDFIERWELGEGQYNGIYHPQWRNVFVTRDPTDFLLVESNKKGSTNNYKIASMRARNELLA